MFVLCYYENDAQLSKLLSTEEFSGFKVSHHAEVKVLVDRTIEATRDLLAKTDVLQEGETFEVFLVEQYKAVIGRMVALQENRMYAVQVRFEDQLFMETKTQVPVPLTGGWLPQVPNIAGVHSLVLLQGDNEDRVLLHGIPQ